MGNSQVAELVEVREHLQEANRKLKQTQAQLSHNEKMAWLGQLVAEVAHEINNPLAFVVNNLFIVERELGGIAQDLGPHLPGLRLKKLREIQTCLEDMREGLDRVKTLAFDLRIFSRREEAEFKTVDVADTIDSVLLSLRHRTDDRIHVQKHYGSERMLYCCVGRLQQLLVNLLANAVDAIPAAGEIIVTTSQHAALFLISIRDSGAGIPAAIRSKIFDPFFTTKSPGQGTGLGLAISCGIVQEHGGSIEMQSVEGAGTEFIVKIPRDLEWQKQR